MAQNIVFRVVADTQPAVDGMNKLDDATKKTKKDVSGLDDALSKVGGMVAGAFAVSELINFGKEMTKVTAQIQSLTIRMSELTGSEALAVQKMNELMVLSDKLGMSFKDVSTNFVQFVSAAKASGVEVNKAEKIFIQMSKAIQGSGASSEQAQRAFVALTQMMGKGQITAEEWKGQFGEAIPQAMGWLQQATGKTTKELMKMMEQGQLSSDVLVDVARVAEEQTAGAVDKMSDSISANLNRLDNAWVKLYTTVGESGIASAGVKALLLFVNGLEHAFTGLQFAVAAVRTAMGDTGKMTEFMVQMQASAVAQYRAEKAIEATKYAQTILDSNKKKSAEEQVIILQRQANTLEGAQETSNNLTEQQIKDNIVLQEKAQALRDLASSLVKEKEKSVGASAKELKAQEKLRKEQEKIQALKAKEEGIQPGAEQNAPELARQAFLQQFFKWQDGAYERNEKKRLAGIDKLQDASEQFIIDQKSVFNSELILLNDKYTKTLITDEDYLKDLAKLREKYGLKEKKDTETKETEIANIKASKQQLVRQMAIDTASGTVDTIMAYKQKELDGEAEMIEKQREAGLIGQEQYDQQLRAIKRKQAVADRINAIANIAIGTAVQVATNPPPLAPFLIALGAIQTGIVLAQPMPYNKGTKRVPMMRGAMRGRDSVHAILTPDERVVPADINMQPGYSALLDLAQDKKISDKEAGFLADLATSGMRRTTTQQSIDPDTIGRAIAKYIPHTNVAINERGIAVITERSQTEIRRLRRRIS